MPSQPKPTPPPKPPAGNPAVTAEQHMSGTPGVTKDGKLNMFGYQPDQQRVRSQLGLQ